ncbi:MAG: hypothetical protein J1G02_00540 [Clostridiales bacterium]|nr:hypothetical protein [Clostridiales bacterium]
MNYELLILNNAIRMKKTANILTKELELIAMRSYDTTYWRDGTMGQIQAIADISEKIDECNAFCTAVKKALLIVPKTYRALLVTVYFKYCDKKDLAIKYKVSMSTVYRKIRYAREAFKRALESIGCDEQWFSANYGHYNFICGE